MARISLQTLEQVQLLQQKYAQSGQPNPLLARLSPGDILQAKVTNALGNNLFALNIAGSEFTTSSSAPLAPGQQLTLQVTTNQNGQPNLRVITLIEGAIASATSRPTVTNLDNQQSPEPAARAVAQSTTVAETSPAVTANRLADAIPVGTQSTAGQTAAGEPAVLVQLQSLATQLSQPADTDASTVSPQLAKLLQPGGPLARLVAERPDLAPRIEQLLQTIEQRPAGLGKEIQQLVDQINTVLRSASPPVQSELRTAQDRLLSQLFGSTTLEQPEQLAQQLADRLGQWARGFEGAVSRELTLVPRTEAPIQGTTSPADLPAASNASNSAPLDRPQAATPGSSTTVLAEGKVPADPGAVATNVDAKVQSNAGQLPQVIRGTFDGDLKGQLLELRTQLESLAASPQEVPQAIQQAITRVDSMLQQVTAQQVRNLQGLNQYLYAELPVDPRTGIQEARLQVFYRNQGSTPKAKDPDRFTVALFLNLSKLGDVSAVVSGMDRAVTVGFTVEDPKVASMLEGQSQLLRDSLVRSGHAGATVTVRRATKEDVRHSGDDPLWSQFLEIQPIDGDPGSRLNAEA